MIENNGSLEETRTRFVHGREVRFSRLLSVELHCQRNRPENEFNIGDCK